MDANARVHRIIEHLADGALDEARDDARELLDLLESGEPIEGSVHLTRTKIIQLCQGIWRA